MTIINSEDNNNDDDNDDYDDHDDDNDDNDNNDLVCEETWRASREWGGGVGA